MTKRFLLGLFTVTALALSAPAQAQIPDDDDHCTSIPQPGGCTTPSPSPSPTTSPSPSPSPTVEPSPEPSPIAIASPTVEAGLTPGPSPSPEPTEEAAEPLEVSRVNTVPAELPRTGLDTLTLLFLAADSALLGLYLRRRARRLSLEAFREETRDADAG